MFFLNVHPHVTLGTVVGSWKASRYREVETKNVSHLDTVTSIYTNTLLH